MHVYRRDELELTWVTRLTSHERVEIAALMNRVIERDTNLGFPGPLPELEMAELLDEMNAEIVAGKKELLLIRPRDGQVMGQLALIPNRAPNCRHLGEIVKFFLHPSQRGKGLVPLVAEELVRRARSLGLDTLHCSVRDGTHAARLFQRIGFAPFGVFPDFARDKGKSHSCLFLHQSVAGLARHFGVTEIERGTSAVVHSITDAPSGTARGGL